MSGILNSVYNKVRLFFLLYNAINPLNRVLNILFKRRKNLFYQTDLFYYFITNKTFKNFYLKVMKNSIILSLIVVLSFNINSYSIGTNLFISDSGKTSSKNTPEEYRQHLKDLDKFYSEKQLGSFIENGKTVFRLFAPQASEVILETFQKAEAASGKLHSMIKDSNGVWETSLEGSREGLFYGYHVIAGRHDKNAGFLCIDPYAKAVASCNTYLTPRKSIVIAPSTYNWEGDQWIRRNWEDAVIYEMHIKDQTAHPSSGAKAKGAYKGLTEKGIKGGIDYIKSLGINTVELLPAQEFANVEIPYKDSLSGYFNIWNPYERNHWGYMTAAFFAPEEYYSFSSKEIELKKWEGTDARQINDFKDMVKAFHKEGIAVFMDVVYNHISEFEIGNLKEIDKEYYFRLNDKGNFISESGCGNDFKTERPMARRLIIESVLYWMKEYHIDGFRFDLAKMIDWETVEQIIREAQKINPDVVIIAEPWGGGYDPAGFSLRGWGAWNDQIRNGIKGQNPFNGLGWIFGNWYDVNNLERIKSFVSGTLAKDKNGVFQKPEHSVNYLESHDDNTFGDFVRFATREVDANAIINDVDKNAIVTPQQMKYNKLGAAFLFTARGMVMIHAGQEFARSKVITFNSPVNDTNKGRIDHNSYNKDNETNYINYNHAEINRELVNYYKGLAELRIKFEAFRRAEEKDIAFMDTPGNEFGLAYTLNYKNDSFFVAFNADKSKTLSLQLPEGNWDVIVDKNKAGIEPLRTISGNIEINSTECLIAKLKK